MIKWAIIFAIIGLIAGALGFGGMAGAAMGIAKFLFWAGIIIAVVLFLVWWVVARILRNRRRAQDPNYRAPSADEAAARVDALLNDETLDHRAKGSRRRGGSGGSSGA